jgi:hypothetical protein
VLPADVRLATQGHVLLAGDFLATLAVEATIHHLDLVAGDESLSFPVAWMTGAPHSGQSPALAVPRFRPGLAACADHPGMPVHAQVDGAARTL